MKKNLLILLIAIAFVSMITGCNSLENKSNVEDEKNNPEQTISIEEKKRMELYIAVMEGAFREENGGNAFIAVKLDTLEGLSDEAKLEVLKEFRSLSPNAYNFDDVKDDKDKFEVDEEGRLRRTLDGSLLWVEVEEYNGKKAKITGVSWFGNLGAVFLNYEVIFVNGEWQLKLINIGVS